jgi:NCS1 family nucleobase:cation symporter-1
VAGEPGDRAERSAEADDPWNLNRIMPAEGALRNREVAEAIERGSAVWGIRPVPDDRRLLRGLDIAVLWGDLSIGLLVLVSGALLVPALGLRTAMVAIVVGSAIGCVPLALVGVAGSREGVPSMVLFRSTLGSGGSAIPTVLNLAQLIGWTVFEFWAMGQVAAAVSRELFGFSAVAVWTALVAVICTGLAIGGPVLVVRRWLERFGFWVVLTVSAWVTLRVLSAGHLAAAWSSRGSGGFPFWAAVDLVIAMPVSWLPLVADYNRFARRSGTSTFASYAIGNVWFYALGALLVLGAGANPDVLDIGTKIAALAGGAVVLLTLLVGETDNAMANIYSSAVSAQNLAPEVPQRPMMIAIGAIGLIAALLIGSSISAFESFLFLIGSVFVPLFGVFAADYFFLRDGRLGEEAIFDEPPPIRATALIPWAVGFVLYQWCLPTGPAWWTEPVAKLFSALHLPFPLVAGSPFGGSLPGFAGAFAVALIVLRGRKRSIRTAEAR